MPLVCHLYAYHCIARQKNIQFSFSNRDIRIVIWNVNDVRKLDMMKKEKWPSPKKKLIREYHLALSHMFLDKHDLDESKHWQRRFKGKNIEIFSSHLPKTHRKPKKESISNFRKERKTKTVRHKRRKEEESKSTHEDKNLKAI